jgi:hypothetical protein
VPVSTKTAETSVQPLERWRIGLTSEHRELAIRLAERPELLVLESDPLSGASVLLALVLEGADQPAVRVDARVAGSALDLAMSIATAAVSRLAPQALSWWNGADTFDVEGLRLSRTVSRQGIDLDRLRTGSGAGVEQLRHALELAAELSGGTAVLALDHLDDLLERLSERTARAVLGVFRAEHQRAGSLQQLLVGRTGGRLASALRDPGHQLYRAGTNLQLRRPRPQRFVDDMEASPPEWKEITLAVVGAAAELANGAPAYVWRLFDATRAQAKAERDVHHAWRGLREHAEPSTAQQFRLLGSVHRAAPTVVCAIANGIGPYELPLNPKSVNDALTRMRARGQVFAPEKQRWAISDPLLAEWARENAPVWVRRRAQR